MGMWRPPAGQVDRSHRANNGRAEMTPNVSNAQLEGTLQVSTNIMLFEFQKAGESSK